MINFKRIIYMTLIFLTISACQSISNKIEDTTKKEQQELSKWLNQSESNLKNFYGQPNEVKFLKSGNRNYIYNKKKYQIICERKFKYKKKN